MGCVHPKLRITVTGVPAPASMHREALDTPVPGKLCFLLGSVTFLDPYHPSSFPPPSLHYPSVSLEKSLPQIAPLSEVFLPGF